MLAEKKLLEQNILTHQAIRSINQLAKEEVDKAFQFAEESPFPKKEDAFKDIYAGV